MSPDVILITVLMLKNVIQICNFPHRKPVTSVRYC